MRIKLSYCLFLISFNIIILTSIESLFAAGSSPVEINHWAYEIVDRFAVNGYLNGFALGTKPYSRSDFVDIINDVDSTFKENNHAKKIDLELLHKLKSEFEYDLNDTGKWPEVKRSQYHLLDWNGSDYRWTLNPVGRIAGYQTGLKNPDDDWFSNTSTIGIVSRGYFRDDVDFYFYFRDTRFGRDADFNSPLDLIIEDEGITSVTFQDNNASFDRTYASLSFKSKWINAGIGRYKLNWGPSPIGGLLLSDYSVPFDMLMLQYPGKRVRATFIAGSLRTDVIDSVLSYQTPSKYRKNFKKKYIATHRLEFLPWKNLTLGFSESAIYGERGFDLGYLIPVMFYWSEQHYLGDRDNLLISLDATYYPFPKYKFYTSIILDDLTIGKLGGDDWANKWAVQLGVQNTDPLGIAGLSVGVEYIRIEPYVYTHFFNVNSYTNHDQFLGYPLQPNSDKLVFHTNYWLKPSIKFNAKIERIRHGDNPPGGNVGGDILLGHRTGDPDTKDFLSGIKDDSIILSFGGSYEFFPEAFFGIEGRYLKNNYNGTESKQYRLLASVSYRYY
ncbi:MAG: capsule assembly Wzi family protein [candidate division Zixibacteria bacterium]|nr:capsule assembly Wzi family protein [candidate division Zixibacteria bacterium]